MAFWVTQPRMHAAFLYQGVSGAFEAMNPYSFPLGCSATVKEPASNCSACGAGLQAAPFFVAPARPDLAPPAPARSPHCGCGPQDLQWMNSEGAYGATGVWDSSCSCPLGSLQGCRGCDNFHCQFGPAPESGMGAIYADGLRTPSGVLLSMLRSAQASRVVKMSGVEMLKAKGVYPLAWEEYGQAVLLLSNPSPNSIHGLPSVDELIPTARWVWQAVRLAQRSKDSKDISGLDGFDSPLPLLGYTQDAPRFKGPARQKLGPLEAFQVVQLWVSFAGCVSAYGGD
ncbi:unnamed protein product [Effrenium voratum]|nr:unnamed protein product [Effrenium voratum]